MPSRSIHWSIAATLQDPIQFRRQFPQVLQLARFVVLECTCDTRLVHAEFLRQKIPLRTREQLRCSRAIQRVHGMVAGGPQVFLHLASERLDDHQT